MLNAPTGLVNMKIFFRNCLVVLIGSLSTLAYANPCEDGGIGGTGISLERGIGGTGTATENGLGGTGITKLEKGIGGTGIQANNAGIGGTGIVGVITGFGSICVNGLEVLYYTDTPADLNGKRISSQDLSIGQLVAIKATGNESVLLASEIHAYYQISGPITAIDVSANLLKVMGKPVLVNSNQLKGMKVGQWINVSGLRNGDGSIVATRIDQTSAQKNVQMIGNLTHQGSQYYLDGTKVNGLPAISSPLDIDTKVTGTWNGNAISVRNVTAGPVTDLLQKVDYFNIQGIASNEVSVEPLNLNGQRITVTSNTLIVGSSGNTTLTGKPIIVRGQMKDGKPTALFIVVQKQKFDFNRQHNSKSRPANANSASEPSEKSSLKENGKPISSITESNEKSNSIENTKDSKKIDTSEQIDKAEKIEKVEKVEKIEVVEKIERIEKVDLYEPIEKVEHD
jgi:hypothetical protein